MSKCWPPPHQAQQRWSLMWPSVDVHTVTGRWPARRSGVGRRARGKPCRSRGPAPAGRRQRGPGTGTGAPRSRPRPRSRTRASWRTGRGPGSCRTRRARGRGSSAGPPAVVVLVGVAGHLGGPRGAQVRQLGLDHAVGARAVGHGVVVAAVGAAVPEHPAAVAHAVVLGEDHLVDTVHAGWPPADGTRGGDGVLVGHGRRGGERRHGAADEAGGGALGHGAVVSVVHVPIWVRLSASHRRSLFPSRANTATAANSATTSAMPPHRNHGRPRSGGPSVGV